MNSSLLTADRATHLKIVVIGLIVAIVVAAFGISNHIGAGYKMPIDSAIVIVAIVFAVGFCGAALAWAMQGDMR